MNLYTGVTFRGWVEKAMEQERLDKELETESRVKSNQSIGLPRRLWNEKGKLRFSPYFWNPSNMGRNSKPFGSQVTVGQPTVPPRQNVNNGNQIGGNLA